MVDRKPNSLAEAALISAIAVVISLVAFYAPMIASFVGLLLPVPFLILTLRHGLRYTILGLVVATLLTSLLGSPIMSVTFITMFAPAGIALGIAFNRGYTATKAFLTGMGVSVLAKIAGFALIYIISGVLPLSVDMATLEGPLNDSLQIYRSMGVPEADLMNSKAVMQEIIEILSLLMPMMLLSLALLDTAACFFITGRLLKRLGMPPIPTFPDFDNWRLPIFFPYLLGFSLVGIYWGNAKEVDLLYQLSMNGYVIAMMSGLLQGISLTQFVMNRSKLSLLMRALIYFIIMKIAFLAQMLAFTGLFDMIFDYRKRFESQQQP